MPRLLTLTFTTAAFRTEAAYGGLKPPPTRRLRRTYLHLSYSTTLSRLLDTSTRKVAVGTVKKSKAAIASRWFLRNVSQRWLESGGELHCARYRETVDSEISNPNFRSSPWIRGAPQVGFSSAIDRIRPRSSLVIFGRPGRRRERKRQYPRNPARCQPTTVSGFTTTSTLAHFDHPRRKIGR